MIATLAEQRHIVLPPEVEEKTPLPVGQQYHVLVSTTGDIMLRPKRKRQKSLLEHLRGMQGLEIQHRRDRIPKPVVL
ncbi:MAG: hypothetical protein IAE77_01555 [Prosthecobacter sp.]|jgi:antitoxin component of MazEF toxin-antitoxin module|uniref:hypothetical protein n=1 Tax=Prosthecobacter sp. TaxID=1965333 RepID=UPI0019DF18F4|nr:hypothetical protein [Prosthecobacter sp.]MBE2282128.1 hypothetical protein [Prosthecobacter sp.]